MIKQLPRPLARLSKETRYASIGGGPKTLNLDDRTVDCVLSRGTPVERAFGTEKLQISASAVNLSRLETSGIAILNSHNHSDLRSALGRLARVWFEGSTMLGRVKFNQTDEGENAWGMVARGEISSVSVGYSVQRWQVTDEDGRVIDPEFDRIDYNGDYTFLAVRWTLLEASLVSVPADEQAIIRSHSSARYVGTPEYIRAARVRMQARHRMMIRQRMRDKQRALGF